MLEKKSGRQLRSRAWFDNPSQYRHDGAVPGAVLHNGIVVQNHVTLAGQTLNRGKPFYRAHGPSPIKLQDHSDPVSFRNIWVRDLE